MPYYSHGDVVNNDTMLMRLSDLLETEKLEEALLLLKSFFSGIPYNAEHQDENHYKTLFFLIFKLRTPFVVRTEECSAAGRADAIVETATAVYVFEFKLDGNGTAADGPAKKRLKNGVSFDEAKRTLGEWKIVEG